LFDVSTKDRSDRDNRIGGGDRDRNKAYSSNVNKKNNNRKVDKKRK
jgi:hypothetical protein